MEPRPSIELSGAAREKWDLIPEDKKDFANLDLLTAYCVAFARWRESEEWLRGGSEDEDRLVVTIRDEKGNIKSHGPSPQIKISRDAVKEMQALALALGL